MIRIIGMRAPALQLCFLLLEIAAAAPRNHFGWTSTYYWLVLLLLECIAV